MLRSNHLQPGMNLNTMSFPSADLTLKVRRGLPQNMCITGS